MKKNLKRTKNNLSLSLVFSIGLHLILVGGLVYASTQYSVPLRLESDDGMGVVMVELAGGFDTTEESVSQSPIDELNPQTELTEPEVMPDPIIDEPDTPQQPEEVIEETIEPITEPKIVIPEKKVEKKVPPKEKPIKKPKPINKPKPAQQHATSSNNSATTQTRSASAGSSQANSGAQSGQGGKPLSRAKPGYPDRARAMGIEGKVIVNFDVNSSGKVENITIISETPKNMFAREVRKAMLRWRYEQNKPAKNLQTTFIFNLSGQVQLS